MYYMQLLLLYILIFSLGLYLYNVLAIIRVITSHHICHITILNKHSTYYILVFSSYTITLLFQDNVCYILPVSSYLLINVIYCIICIALFYTVHNNC